MHPAAAPGRRWPRSATLEFTWIYNDFFWAILLMQTGDKFPITSALNNLQGQFFTDNNLLAAGVADRRDADADRVLRAPEAVRRGLTLGSTKG